MITSKQNEKIKFLCKLRDRTKRDRFKMFLVEGYRELSRALHCGVVFDAILFCKDLFKNENSEWLIIEATERGIVLYEANREVFEKVSNRENCDGLIGVANFWRTELDEVKLSQNALILVADAIEKPGNLGALMRSAESAGANGLILCNPVTDIFNPSVIRSSQGALFGFPVVVTERDAAFSFLESNSMSIFATTPSVKNLYFNERFHGSVAIVVGSEHKGLSDFWLKNCDVKKIAIPQAGMSDSLNVNDAAVVVLYEVVRQRAQVR